MFVIEALVPTCSDDELDYLFAVTADQNFFKI